MIIFSSFYYFFQVNPQQEDTDINEIHDDLKKELTKAKAEIDWLKLENEQLHQRIQKMTLPVPSHQGLQDSGHYDPQNPWDLFQSIEPEFSPHSFQVSELTSRLEQTKAELKQMQEKVNFFIEMSQTK